MNVFRKVSVKLTDGFHVGDQIVIRLNGFNGPVSGGFSATVQKVDKITGEALFFFDDCVCFRPIGDIISDNPMDFTKTPLYAWLNSSLLLAFPDDVRERMVGVDTCSAIRVPYWGELFDRNDETMAIDLEYITYDSCKQLPRMAKSHRERAGSSPQGNACWYWLMNARKNITGAYSVIYGNGAFPSAEPMTSPGGVRPVFVLKPDKNA